jgi:hypothetical protein
MSWYLRSSDQRWGLSCDRAGCLSLVMGCDGEPELQRESVDRSTKLLGWVRRVDIGDFCPTHAVDVPTPIPRDELCQRDAWCVLRAGHVDGCQRIGKRATSLNETGPQMAGKRRY